MNPLFSKTGNGLQWEDIKLKPFVMLRLTRATVASTLSIYYLVILNRDDEILQGVSMSDLDSLEPHWGLVAHPYPAWVIRHPEACPGQVDAELAFRMILRRSQIVLPLAQRMIKSHPGDSLPGCSSPQPLHRAPPLRAAAGQRWSHKLQTYVIGGFFVILCDVFTIDW